MTTWSAIAELAHPGESIRERRIELGWTQVELAAKSGIPQADISRLENGHLDARWSTIHRISAVLADTAQPARRSLANGRRTTRLPDSTATRWAAKGTTLPIERTKR